MCLAIAVVIVAETAPVKEGKENGCRGQLKNLTCTVRGI